MKENLQEATIKALLENKCVESDNDDNDVEIVWTYTLDEIKSMSASDLDEEGELASISKFIDDDTELVISLFYGMGDFVLYANIFGPNGDVSDHPINSLDVKLTTEDALKQDMIRLMDETISEIDAQ